jgi:hypothetical protein
MLVHRRTARLLTLACATTALAVTGAPSAVADHGSSSSPLVKAGHRVQGATPGEWLGRWWTAVLETSFPGETLTPFCVPLARRVVAVVVPPDGGQATCTVRKGDQLMLVPDTTSCSDWEEPPFHGDTPAARRRCAHRILAGAGVHEVTVDGRRFRLDDAYRAQAPDLGVILPEDNFLGAPAGTPIRFGGEGWVAFTKPLRRDRHEIVVHGTGSFDGESYDVTGVLHIDVA